MEKSWAGPFADRWPRLDNSLSVEMPLSVEMSLSGEEHNLLSMMRHLLLKGLSLLGIEFCFSDCYWEWLEFVIGRNSQILYNAHLFGAVTTSLYTYDRNSDVVRSFCEA